MLHASSALLGIRLSFRPKPQPEAGRLICREARPFLLRRHSNATASVSPRCQPVLQASQTESPEASTSSSIAAMTPVKTADGSFNDFPQTTGVYSIYSPDGQLQYIGLSRKVNTRRNITCMASLSNRTAPAAMGPCISRLLSAADSNQHCYTCPRPARPDA